MLNRSVLRRARTALAPLLMAGAVTSYAQSPDILIRGGWLFDGTGDTVVINPGILIRAGKIIDVDSWGEFLTPFCVHRELHAMVLAGISPADAIRIATINGARALNVADTLGTVEPGKLADLVIIEGNPLRDIRNTRYVQVVIKAGRIYDPKELLNSVRGTIGPAGPDDESDWIQPSK